MLPYQSTINPSSDGPYTFVVQQDVVGSWPGSPLPTDYWTRPVSPENREWWTILGNYPSTGIVAGVGRGVSLANWPADTNKYMSNYGYIPYVQGPKSAHIVWKQQASMEDSLEEPWELHHSRTAAAAHRSSITDDAIKPLLKLQKRWLTVLTTTCLQAFGNAMTCGRDKYIGNRQESEPKHPQRLCIVNREMDVVPGETASTLGMRVDLMYVGSGRLITYNAFTGAVKVNISISPMTTGTYYASYDWPYFLTVQDLGAAQQISGGRYRLINWTMAGDHVGFSSRKFQTWHM